ncbi:hypothetical protein AMELA_G00188820 [Ameiurus melas]|uniref:ITPR-interacting domain-containing protein n=1 Tax=Ameiurus melas TaxID=219545 RepID=A0A7J6AAK4_AMEME|nr:hypothetical protein AMELA_G00188820 [Ameiurus melas]
MNIWLEQLHRLDLQRHSSTSSSPCFRRVSRVTKLKYLSGLVKGLLAMDSPCPVNRRQAWAQCSRHWLTVEDTELHASSSSNAHTTAAAQHSLQDEIFSDGCSTGKIETWLQSCGNEANQDSSSQLTLESLLKTANSFEDDLSLGAEATRLDDGLHDEAFGHCPLLLPPPKSRRKDLHTSTPQQRLNLPLRNMGHSMTSSIFSSTTNKTASSVSEVLQMCAEDAEETLYQLGFGCEEPQVTARIPARFFTFPSQLRGINFRLFLESQLRRIREEDPSLSLASRFRQVEVLTAMANAFYSLYSHVSRTPLQKLAPPEFSFSSPTAERSIGQRFFGNVRTEPRSPVERLKDTVSKMCLYTRGSDSASPNCSPRKRNSLPDVAEIIVGNMRCERSHDQSRGMWGQAEDSNITQKVKDEKALQHAELKADVKHHTRVTVSTQVHSSQPDQQRYLSPSNSSTSQINSQLKQANSFELEEVQSVGEEENTSLEQSSAYTLSVTASTHQKCSTLRGDSFQSDSSGYVEEDMQNLLSSTNLEIS